MNLMFNHRRLQGRTLLPVGAILVAATALALALAARRQLVDELRMESIRTNELRTALGAADHDGLPACATEANYALSLPTSVSLDRLVQSLQDSAKAFDVSVKSVSGEPHAPTAQALAALDVNIALHGAYPGIKAALAEGLSRFETGTLTHLHLKRDGASLPPVEDATAQVSFALRPPMAAPRDCRVAEQNVDVPGAAK